MAKKNLVINGKRAGALAGDVDFNNANTGLESTNVQDAIVEVNAKIGSSSGGGGASLANKKIGIIGDSFTAGGTWVSKMATLLGASITNKAISGGRWSYTESIDYTSAIVRAQELYSAYSNSGVQPDYIVALFGVNDYANSIQVGSINYNSLASQSGNTAGQVVANIMSHYNVAGSTFAAGIQSTIAYLQLMFPNAIVFVGWTPDGQQYMRAVLGKGGGWDSDITPTGQSTIYAANKYINILKQLALMHGVRYIDTFNCGINPWLVDHQNAYQSALNNAHPYTEAAGDRIAAYMARLLLKEA